MEGLRTCCLNADSFGGMRARKQSLLVASKKSVFKLINSSSAKLSDLSQLKDPDLESSICVARKDVQSYPSKAIVNPCSACVDSNGHKELTHQSLNI
jgi:hypothetical protein